MDEKNKNQGGARVMQPEKPNLRQRNLYNEFLIRLYFLQFVLLFHHYHFSLLNRYCKYGLWIQFGTQLSE
jgi:hypothetical protein